MTKYIIHPGTNTWIDLSDEVYFVDTERITDDRDSSDEVGDSEVEDYVRTWGSPIDPDCVDADTSNSILFTPSALLYEISEGALSPEVRAWASNLSVDELGDIASRIMQDDDLWGTVSHCMRYAIQDAYDEKNPD